MVHRSQLEPQFVDGWRVLPARFLSSAADSFSMRILGHEEMMLATGLADWANIRVVDIETAPFLSTKALPGLHGAIYRQRVDAGAVIISSPPGARVLAGRGGLLPPLFDEQARHIGGRQGNCRTRSMCRQTCSGMRLGEGQMRCSLESDCSASE